jgi:WD40 repeat protein
MFSSVTGDSVVTVCWDHKLRIYDIRNGTGDITPKKQISHNNNTGKWLTTFKVKSSISF